MIRSSDQAPRATRFIRQAIERLELDLTGRAVYTEAASNAFVWTPIIAALAGARVTAQTRDSRYGLAREVEAATLALARSLRLEERLRVVRQPDPAALAATDIITNLGFVRPLDAAKIACLPPHAVICLMWEPWELRAADIDLAACRRRGLPVLGTNERDPRVATFRAVGLLAVKLVLERGLEILGCRVALLGAGPFADEAAACLTTLGATVCAADRPGVLAAGPFDAALCLEHHRHDLVLVGPGGVLDTNQEAFGQPEIIHICGLLDVPATKARGWTITPDQPARPGVMSFTTAHLGVKPVIDLHTAGLRVGQAWLEQDEAVLARLAMPV